MDDIQLERYSRQILLHEIDLEGQQKLANSQIMIVGIGGLGNIASMALASAGCGVLHLWEHDVVELSNLARQPLYTTDDVGTNKAQCAKQHLTAINPHCNIIVHERLESVEQAQDTLANCDVILDCSDKYRTRLLVNKLAVMTSTPLISGAAIRFEGQVMTFLNQGGPCYQCLPSHLMIQDVACRDVGVLNTQVMMIGIWQAHIAMKHLLGITPIKDGLLMTLDGKLDQLQQFYITKSDACSICAE